MTKYSSEFKIKVVQEYLQGKGGAAALAKKYHIASAGGVKNWIQAYQKGGKVALEKRKRANQVYSRAFKEKAVQLYLTSELTYQEISYQFDIRTIGLLCTWVNQFRKYGEIPEVRKRGKPRNIENTTVMKDPKTSQEDDKTRIKELEKQLRYAHIEVDYLKGLRRLGQEAHLRNKPNSSIVSDKNTSSKKF